MTEELIAKDLFNHLIGLGSSLQIAWPNLDFNPPKDGSNDPLPYLQADLLPAQTTAAALGSAGQNRHTGIFQITIVQPEGSGLIDPLETADSIIAHFKRGTSITGDGDTIRIDGPPYTAPSFKDGAYRRLPVLIPYRVETSNPA